MNAQHTRPRHDGASPKLPRHLFAKAVGIASLAVMGKVGIDEILHTRFPADPHARSAARWLQRSAVDIADTTSPDWAGDLVGSIVADFVATASPFSAFFRLRDLGSRFIVDQFGRVVVPTRLNLTAPPNAAFVGQGGAIPVGAPKIGAETLDPVKVAGIAPLTDELLAASNSQAERAITGLLLEDLAEVIDLKLTDDRPAIEGLRPAGLLNGVVPVASVDAATDLAALAGAMATAKARLPALLLDPARLVSLWGDPAFGPQLVTGRLAGMVVIPTYSMSDPGRLIAVDAGAFASAIGEPEILAGKNATLVMASADMVPPTHAIDDIGAVGPPNEVLPDGGIMVTGGVIGTGTANAVALSMLQQYSTAVRVVEPVAWTLTRAGAVAGVTGADW